MTKTKSQQAQEYAEKKFSELLLTIEKEPWPKTREILAKAYSDGYTAAEQSMTLAGCEDNRQDKSESGVSRNLCSERITRFGHYYLYFYDGLGGYTPVNVIHDPDCPCHEKGGNEE